MSCVEKRYVMGVLLSYYSRGTSASFGKSSLKHSKSFRIISSNQKLAQALTSTPGAIMRTNTSYCLATSGTKTAGSNTSRRSDRAIKWHLFSRLTNLFYFLLFHILKASNETFDSGIGLCQFLIIAELRIFASVT